MRSMALTIKGNVKGTNHAGEKDFQNSFQSIRAPTLLLLDSEGQVLWRQDEVVTDEYPFDLNAFESQIELLRATKQ